MQLSDFLTLYHGSSQKTYQAGVRSFLQFIYKLPKGETAAKANERVKFYDEIGDRYIEELRSGKRNVNEDLVRYSAHSAKEGVPPLSYRNRMSCTREWLMQSGFEISTKDNRRIQAKGPKGKSRTLEADLDHESLKQILTHCDAKSRSLFLLLLSSGGRVGECLQLRITDIDLTSSPPCITIPGEFTKSGENRFTFCSQEAKEAIIEWLRIRDNYVRAAKNKNNGLIEAGRSKARGNEDRRLFPFDYATARSMWENACKKAGLFSVDPRTDRAQRHVHQMRKFFRSQLALKVPVDIVEALMGHSAYLTDAYRRYSKKQIMEFYKQGEYLLAIQTPKEIQELQNEVLGKLQNQTEIVEKLVGKNIRLEEEHTKILNDVKILTTEIESMKEKERRRTELLEYIDQYPDLLQILKRVVSSDGNND